MPALTVPAVSGLVRDWPQGFSGHLPPSPWTVVHARPRQEKKLASDLERLGLPGVLLLERRVHHYAKSVQVTEVPLLGGYVFTLAGRERYEDIYRTERTVRILAVPERMPLADDLRTLIALITRHDAPLVVRPELEPGTTVILRQGTLAGLRGIIARRQNRVELVVNLELLGQSVSATVPASWVDPA